MDDRLIRLSAALAVPTRFAIYRHVLNTPEGVSVQDVADKFGIHPNVARLHLSRLEEVGLVVGEIEHTGRGGRPGRLYRAVDKSVSISLPHRDYETLADIALTALERFKHNGEQMITAVAEEKGYDLARRYLEEHDLKPETLTPEEIVEHVRRLSGDPGLSPDVEPIDEDAFRLAVHNCAFKEQAFQHPTVCTLHHAYLKGIFRAFLGKSDLIEEQSMIDGAPVCRYIAVRLP
ncbi:MAG: helix-turn-helix domain-containing protein [Hydrogenibacillus schlegelii]|nr:helix-turn-helix domain-containing protein [Hydrogenibacillus schlegelii]